MEHQKCLQVFLGRLLCMKTDYRPRPALGPQFILQAKPVFVRFRQPGLNVTRPGPMLGGL
jgi:hypothetical protein